MGRERPILSLGCSGKGLPGRGRLGVAEAARNVHGGAGERQLRK